MMAALPMTGISISAIVKPVTRRGALDEKLRRGEALAVLVRVAAHAAEQLGRTERVGITERTAAERREAEPKDRADVAVARIAENAFGEATDRLRDHLDREALAELVERPLLLRVGFDPEHFVDALIDLLSLPLLLSLHVEAFAALAPGAAVFDELVHAARRLNAIAERRRRDLRNLRCGVDADFVEQSDR